MSGLRAARRAAVLAAALLALTLLAVRGALAVRPPVRDAFTLYAVSVDTSVLLARLGTGSTGFYDRQVTSRLAALPAHGFPVEHRAMLGPAELGPDGLAAGSDGLTREGGGWHLRIAGDDVQVRASLSESQPGACPPAPGAMSGVLGVGDGANASTGLVLDGTGLVVHTVARGVVDARALYVLTRNFSLGIDPIADCPAWVSGAGQSWTGPAPEVPAGSAIELELGPWHLAVEGIDEPLRMDSYGQLLPIERLAMFAAGWPEPHQVLQRARVTLTGPGATVPLPGFLLDRTVR